MRPELTEHDLDALSVDDRLFMRLRELQAQPAVLADPEGKTQEQCNIVERNGQPVIALNAEMMIIQREQRTPMTETRLTTLLRNGRIRETAWMRSDAAAALYYCCKAAMDYRAVHI